MQKDATIYIAGADTMIGAAILRELRGQGYTQIVGGAGEEPDLMDADSVDAFIKYIGPEYIFLAAGKSGGIRANQDYPAELMYNNLLVGCHIVHSAYCHGAKKLLYLASSCSYPKHCAQPMCVDALMSGSLEPTNEAYAVAKIAGIKLCQAYRHQYGAEFVSAIPANAFGSQDDFSLENSHVIPALIRRMHEARRRDVKTVKIWGTGTPRREFIFVDNLADACIFAMNHYTRLEPINLGSGSDLSVAELAENIREVVGYSGKIEYDAIRPDGMPLKSLDSSRLFEMGWRAKTSFQDALLNTYNWFLQHVAE